MCTTKFVRRSHVLSTLFFVLAVPQIIPGKFPAHPHSSFDLRSPCSACPQGVSLCLRGGFSTAGIVSGVGSPAGIPLRSVADRMRAVWELKEDLQRRRVREGVAEEDGKGEDVCGGSLSEMVTGWLKDPSALIRHEVSSAE